MEKCPLMFKAKISILMGFKIRAIHFNHKRKNWLYFLYFEY